MCAIRLICFDFVFFAVSFHWRAIHLVVFLCALVSLLCYYFDSENFEPYLGLPLHIGVPNKSDTTVHSFTFPSTYLLLWMSCVDLMSLKTLIHFHIKNILTQMSFIMNSRLHWIIQKLNLFYPILMNECIKYEKILQIFRHFYEFSIK